MPLLRLLTWMWIYHRKAFLDHCFIIMIVSGYTLAIKSSLVNPEQREWVSTSLCENIIFNFPKESVPDHRYLVVIWELIYVLWCSAHTSFTGVSRVVLGFDSIMMMIYTQMRTGKRFLVVHYSVTVVFLTPLFWVLNAGDTLSEKCKILLFCGSLRRFL